MKLELSSLTGGYGANIVVDGISLTVREHSIVTLIGPNGCGKSTLLKMIGRILRPRNGKILLDGKSINSFHSAVLAQHLAFLPQDHHTAPELTVEELVKFGRFPHQRIPWKFSCRDAEALENALSMTHMRPLRKRPLGSLSGGERQRAWLAMTLAQEPDLLLLDEPTAFLDICRQFEIIELVRSLNRQSGITIVMSLHDLNLASLCSDELVMLKDRAVRHAGSPAEVMTAENLREIFSIEASITMSPENIPYCVVSGISRDS